VVKIITISVAKFLVSEIVGRRDDKAWINKYLDGN